MAHLLLRFIFYIIKKRAVMQSFFISHHFSLRSQATAKSLLTRMKCLFLWILEGMLNLGTVHNTVQITVPWC